MKNKIWFWSALCLFSLSGLIACGKNESQNSNVATVGVLGASCPAGSTLINNNGYPLCQGPGGVTNPIYTGAGVNSYSSDNYCYNSLKISNNSQYQKFAKEALMACGPNGLSCSAFNPGSVRVSLSATATTTALQFYASPQNAGYGFPLSLSMSTFPINNSQGFEGRQYGATNTFANRSLIQVQVAKGHPGDPYFTYTMAYEGIAFMTGTFVRSDNYSYYCGN